MTVSRGRSLTISIPVDAFSATAPDPALGMRICSGRHKRSQNHPGALRLKNPISLEHKLRIPIVNHHAEFDPFVVEPPAEIAGLLGDPGGIRFRSAARSKTRRDARYT